MVIFTLLAIYTFIGAVIFQALEGPLDDNRVEVYSERCKVQRNQSLEGLEKQCKGSISMCLEEAKKAVMAVDSCLRNSKERKPTLPLSNFWNSFVFVFSVYTTVGYGNMSIWSTEARAFFMLYAFFGIPLFYAFNKSLTAFFRSFCLNIFFLCARW